jgi:hypothetical protein
MDNINYASDKEKDAFELGKKFGHFLGRKEGIRETLHLLLTACILTTGTTKNEGNHD